jgi:hypothetical protein
MTRIERQARIDRKQMESMRELAVKDVSSVEEFIRKYHVRNELYHEEFKMLAQSYKEEIEEDGYTMLPAHISVTGEMVTYFPGK